jgi:type VI secretion system protein ImpF
MARSSNADRLSPPLMFAFREAHRERDARVVVDLRDEHGARIIAGRRARKGAVTEGQLREQLSLDLNALLNTINMETGFDLDKFPRVRESILNYGIPEISNRSIDEDGVADIVAEIRTALLLFEPRLIPDALTVTRDMTVDSHSLNIRFSVSGEMACDPAAVAVEFIADIEIDTGKMRIGKR